MSQSIISSISRSDTFPKQIPITITGNKGYISIETTNWTPQMFYELPIIQFDIYADINGTKAKTPFFSKSVNTYNAMFPGKQNISISIPLKNTPENCYLYITPIFDNNAVAARNELIKNGIEEGQIWDTVTETFSTYISFIDKDGGSIIQTITGIPPLSFKANGQLLVSWSISGNTMQNGTPTPSDPVAVDGCGSRTVNLFDKDNANVISCYLTNTARVQSGVDVSSVWIPCDPNTTYTVYRILGERFGIVWTIEQPASGVQGYGYTIGATRDRLSITTGATAQYLLVYYYNGSYDTLTEQQIRDSMMIVEGSTAPASHIPYGWCLPIFCGSQQTSTYMATTQTVRRIKKLVLTGDEGWVSTTTSYGICFGFELGIVFPINSSFCTHFNNSGYTGNSRSAARSSLADDEFICVRSFGQMYFRKDSSTDTEAFKIYLQQQYAAGTPVCVWYALAEPTTGIVNEPLMKIGDYADTVASTNTGAPSIPTSKGSNTLSVDTTIQPSSVSITYTR